MINTLQTLKTYIKRDNPLILNITNEVTTEFVANGLLSLGAAPIMSKAYQEADELVQLAQAVVINPGTLDDTFIQLSTCVCEAANRLQKPIILDPVGAGASQYRTQFNQQLLEHFNIAIIRGNASEIMTLAGATMQTRGVDSTAKTEAAIECGVALARQYHATVVISGRTDAILDEHQIEQFSRGSSLMTQMTGAGCLLSAVIAAFRAVHPISFEAAAAATLFYSLCGESAEQKSQLPASFRVHFLDALSTTE